MKSNKKNNRGIALIMVLTCLALMTAIVVEFAYNSNVNFDIAYNHRDQVQAGYLVHSALNLSKVLISYDKESRNLARQASGQLNQEIRVKPLYEMIKVDSNVLRQLTQGVLMTKESIQSGEAQKKQEEVNSSLTDKLKFEGDFQAEITVLDGKFPLNAFYTLNPNLSQREYDRLKFVLAYLMSQKKYEKLFADKYREPFELASRIADFIDANDVINELGGGDRGSESSSFSGQKMKAKNAKLLSVDELGAVPGMTPQILEQLKKDVTVYRSNEKINFCSASDELVSAMIVAFTQRREDIEALRMDQEDKIKSLREKAQAKCPKVHDISQALQEGLGLTISSGGAGGNPNPGSGGTVGATGGNVNSFASMISSEESYYQIDALGMKDKAREMLRLVLYAPGSNVDQWKELYRGGW